MFWGKQKQIVIDALIEEKNELIKSNKKLENHCRDLEASIQAKNEEILKISSKLTPYISAMERLSLIYSPESQVAYEHHDDLKNVWNYWDSSIHENDQQQLRQYRAQAINYTPLSIDALAGRASFRGTDADYTTSLTSCTCMDFQRHALPCKHMYRLAYELNLFYLDDVQELPKKYNVINMPMFKKIIDRIPKNQYETLYDIFSCDTPIIYQNTTTIAKILQSKLVQISSDNELFISSFTKDELLVHMPVGHKKSLSKKVLVKEIIQDYPDVIAEFQKFYVALEPSIAVAHLRYPASNYLGHLL